MIVAIDYDGTMKRSSTYSDEECEMWSHVIHSFLGCAHTVIIATMREGTPGDVVEVSTFLARMQLFSPSLGVIWCGQQSKRAACREQGFEVDIWIDDMPEMVGPPIKLLTSEERE